MRKRHYDMNHNNQAVVAGEIVSDFEYSHEVFGERFYYLKLKVSRLSEFNDIVPLLISDRLIDVGQSYIGDYMEARGQFRSYNKLGAEKTHLILSLFVRSFKLLNKCSKKKPNSIYLDGYLCKEPVYRVTPFGREITDILLAVNRSYGKSDYIPCICWGRTARYVDTLSVGSRVRLWGRIQSRDYQKRTEFHGYVTHTAYEISVSKMECVEDFDFALDQVADSHRYGY